MAKRQTSLQVVGTDASIGRISALTRTIVGTFSRFDITLAPHDVKISPEALTFLFSVTSTTRMHVVRSFYADLQYALAREDLEIIAPVPNAQLIAVVVYMNVGREIFDLPEPQGVPSPWMQDSEDELYDDARAAVLKAGKASVSYLQRSLRIGYMRASKLISMLEERGVIGPPNGSLPREVFKPLDTEDREHDDDDGLE
jgi:DNA segregation ATPase FtsK/SpoIIIE-like protein